MTILAVGIAIALTGGQAVMGQCQYDLVEMERISCGFFSVGGSPRGMNEQGVVVGRHLTCGGEVVEPFIWRPGEDVEFLPRPPSDVEAAANDVNCHEQAVGWLGFPHRRAVMWDDGRIVELGIPPGGNKSEAMAINDAGQVAGLWGNSATGDPGLAGFLWQDGTMTDLRPILGTENSVADGLNQQGDIVGWMGTSPLIDAHAYVLSDGVVTDLGVVPDGCTGRAADINERGDVIINGAVEHEGGAVNRGALWADGAMVDLGVLPGASTAGALALNNVRQVVGGVDGGGGRAILWQHGTLYDLNDLLLVPHTATVNLAWDINESGQILAKGGNTVLLTPVGRPPTDLDINCRVDVHDLLLLLDEWHQADSEADFDGDGIVGFADLLMLLRHWS